jgi:iron complex outermembrane receptor protein
LSTRPHPTVSALSLLAALAVGGEAVAVDLAEPLPRIEQLIVSATRDPEAGRNLALPWTRIDQSALDLTAAVHISQLMQRSPGTWISRGNGQESLTALRSPVLTGAGGCGGFYMAWDGISLRAPAFCNINQLFDVNSEQAGAVEVVRGPGTAVFGANAVHGVINTLTADPAQGPRQRLAVEAGAHDYYRLRGEFRTRSDRQALGVYFNGATDGGFKDDAGFDQQKLTLRHDYSGDIWTISSAIEGSNLNQETAGFVRGFEAYKDPDARRRNPNPEAYRDSWAVRAYTRWERDSDAGHLSITPYLRRTKMEFLQHFLVWQPTEENGQEGLGLRIALSDSNARLRWKTGLDLDASKGWLLETQADDFSPNLPAGVHYDYEVDALSAAIYGQASWQASVRWDLSAGLRLENNRYDYSNKTTDGSACAPEVSNCRFFRPQDREDSFNNGSVNLGMSYAVNATSRIYLRAAHGFRPPQAAELYRLQAGQEVADLDSETINSVDLGLRGDIRGLNYDLSVFTMRKDNVIFQDADRQNVSGARTSHQGLEFSVYWNGSSGWYAGLDGSLARHRYDSDANLRGSSLEIEGNDIDTAPRHFGSARLGHNRDLVNGKQLRGELEWIHMGEYFLDPDNAHRYAGHELLNLRLQLAWGRGWGGSRGGSKRGAIVTSLRMTNLLNVDYAERADFGFGDYRYFVGQPRGVFFEIAYSVD